MSTKVIKDVHGQPQTMVKLDKTKQMLDDERYKLLLAHFDADHQELDQTYQAWWVGSAAFGASSIFYAAKSKPFLAVAGVLATVTCYSTGNYTRDKQISLRNRRSKFFKGLADEFCGTITLNRDMWSDSDDWEAARSLLNNQPVGTTPGAKDFANREQKKNGLYYIADEKATYLDVKSLSEPNYKIFRD